MVPLWQYPKRTRAGFRSVKAVVVEFNELQRVTQTNNFNLHTNIDHGLGVNRSTLRCIM